mgnify:CR=1 FL=1
MLTTLMDAVYVSGSSTEGPLCTALCESLEAEPLPLIESPAELPDATKLVIFEIRQPDDLFAIEDWLISSREYALVVIGSDEHAETLIKALEAGADDYLLNPEQNIALTVLVLKRAVSRKQELLQSQQTYDELEQLNLELMTSLDLLRQDQQAGRYVQQKMLPDSPWAFQQHDFSYMICHKNSLIYTSRFATVSALSSINFLLGGTSSPIKHTKISSAAIASSIFIRLIFLLAGSIVVSQS